MRLPRLQSVNNARRVDGLLTAVVNIAGMIPQHHLMPQRFLGAKLALVACLAAVPLLTTTHVAAVRATSGDGAAALESEIQSILDLALAPGAIAWDSYGVDEGVEAPPTGINAAVRVPGRDDVVVASGTNVDGTPFDANGPYAAGNIQVDLVRTVAWQLADEGNLDLDATIDAWLPDVPNADRVTIGMLIDYTTGWGRGDVDTPIVADLSRRWTLAEAMESVVGVPPVREPGTTIGTEFIHSDTALGYILEQVTGDSIADLIGARIITPLGLDDTLVQDGTNQPDGYQHGIFAFDGQSVDTSMFPNVSYYTYFGAEFAVVSTSTDLLDLLDALVAGDLFTTDRTPTPERLLGARLLDGSVGASGAPLNGYCPCESAGGNTLDVAAVGRRPTGLGTYVAMIRFPDGISVVLHFNSRETDDVDTIWQFVLAIHDAAAQP